MRRVGPRTTRNDRKLSPVRGVSLSALSSARVLFWSADPPRAPPSHFPLPLLFSQRTTPSSRRNSARARTRTSPSSRLQVRSGYTGPHTTAFAWWTPILKDFARRIAPPRVPRFQSRHTSTPFNSASDAFELHPDVRRSRGCRGVAPQRVRDQSAKRSQLHRRGRRRRRRGGALRGSRRDPGAPPESREPAAAAVAEQQGRLEDGVRSGHRDHDFEGEIESNAAVHTV